MDKKITTYKEKYLELNRQKDLVYEEYIHETTAAGCISCGKYKTGYQKLFENRFTDCSVCSFSSKIYAIANKLDNLIKEIDVFVEQEYAKALFYYYKPQNPQIQRLLTGEQKRWNEIFPDTYSDLSKSDKYTIIGLENKGGKYKVI